MSFIIKAHYDGKYIVPDSPVDLPIDQPLEIEIHLLPQKAKDSNKEIDITSLPFFGMWSDRKDIENSVDWVNDERENWSSQRFDD